MQIGTKVWRDGKDGKDGTDGRAWQGGRDGSSDEAERANLRVGDVIVAVDGWRVDNVLQYRAVRAFPVEGRIDLSIWRGTRLVDITIPNRDFVPAFTIADYPPKGWVQ